MNQIINQYPRQAHFLLIPLSFFLITACPDSPETTDCGDHQVKVNGDCVCEEGYYWNEDKTKCLMDTTSHNFIWEIDTLGGYGSYLRDVAIVDENNIWVVGNIVMPDPDSSFNGTGFKEFNAARWNGEEWELLGIYSNTLDLHSIQYFNENDIWVTTGIIYHWNGAEWERYHLWDMGILGPNDGGVTEIWGTSSSNIYFAGRKGSIVYYNGSTFTKMESGTDVDLKDVWGSPDGTSIWTCGYTNSYSESSLLHHDGSGWETVWKTGQTSPPLPYRGLVKTIWGTNAHSFFVVGSFGIFRQSLANIENVSKDLELLPNSSYRIRGNALNNIFVVGNDGMVLHNNGKSWYYFEELSNSLDKLISVAVTDQEIVAVGQRYYNGIEWYAVIYHGRRQ